jgi:hypothetical protein
VLVSPGGELLAETPVARLDFGTNTRQQIINRMASFPIWTPGICLLKLMVRTPRDAEFRELANVMVSVRYSWA